MKVDVNGVLSSRILCVMIPICLCLLPSIFGQKSKDIDKSIEEAIALIRAGKSQESLDSLLALKAKGHRNNATIENLIGSCHIQLREFGSAATAYKKALKIDPDSNEPKFNLAELWFVSGQYAKAFKAFEKLKKDDVFDRASTQELIDFKLLLCHLKLNEEDEAKALFEEFPKKSDKSRFGRAAVLFYKERGALALESTLEAMQETDHHGASIYLDGLMELGWLEYGQDGELMLGNGKPLKESTPR